ncbi:MAG: flagellin FliC [Nitrospiraceae bacterium]
MGLVVNTNLASLAAQRNLTVNNGQLAKSVEHLSSGLRITRASDDAAGLGVSETLRAHIRSINQANRNANDGISLTQIADGAASSIGSLLSRMRELATQAASGTVGTTERSYLDQEFVALRSEIDRIASVTEFNGQALLSGSNNTFSVFVGFKSGADNSLSLNLDDLDVASVGLTGASISSSAAAQSVLATIGNHRTVAAARAEYGSHPEPVRRRDSEPAGDVGELHRGRFSDPRCRTSRTRRRSSPNQILTQSGIAVLAQANSLPQQALALLQ